MARLDVWPKRIARAKLVEIQAQICPQRIPDGPRIATAIAVLSSSVCFDRANGSTSLCDDGLARISVGGKLTARLSAQLIRD